MRVPGWDCKDGTEDEDHDWEYVSDWYGDPGVINGTADCSFKRCKQCGKESELEDGDEHLGEPDPDYERDRRIDDALTIE
jgi:hypothetical protein